MIKYNCFWLSKVIKIRDKQTLRTLSVLISELCTVILSKVPLTIVFSNHSSALHERLCYKSFETVSYEVYLSNQIATE